MDMSELKKDFLEFVGYLNKTAIINDEHCNVVEHKKTGDSGMQTLAKALTLAAAVLSTTLEESDVCYALLRMSPLSISCAECSVVISCGKVDYDKSGQRGDGRQMWRLCVSDSRMQGRETRSR
jgi:hypothetical protein